MSEIQVVNLNQEANNIHLEQFPGKVNSDISQLSDEDLYQQCLKVGKQALLWTRKFGILLPEVNRRQLYLRYGFHTVFHFAAQIGGLRHKTVHEILRIAQKLQGLPALKQLFESGRAGWSKLRVVLSIATPEKDKFWAEQTLKLSKTALEKLVQVMKKQKQEAEKINEMLPLKTLKETTEVRDTGNQWDVTSNDEIKLACSPGNDDTGHKDRESEKDQAACQNERPGNADSDMEMATEPTISRKSVKIGIDPLIKNRLDDLKVLLEREKKQKLTLSEVLEILLTGFRTASGNAIPYEEIITLCPDCQKHHMKTTSGEVEMTPADLQKRERKGEPIDLTAVKKEVKAALTGKKATRHIPAAVKKVLRWEYNGICGFPGCTNRADIQHHTRRFAIFNSHDPDFIVPLCTSHETIAHAGLIDGEEDHPSTWKVTGNQSDTGSLKDYIDQKVQAYRVGF